MTSVRTNGGNASIIGARVTRACTVAAMVGGAALLLSCRHHTAPAASMSDASPFVTLQRGPCRGRCPEYRVQVFENGNVVFNGLRNVVMSGAQTGTASANDIRDLMKVIARSDFAKADSAYAYGSPSCGPYYTDMPVAILSATVGGQTKTVRHDPGCQKAPAYLKTIATRVDAVANTSRWITGNAGATK